MDGTPMNPAPLASPGTPAPLAIAVDLTPLRPGGLNGGIKPTIFTLLAEAGRIAGDSLFFIYLTRASTHAEVRALARPTDLLLCLLTDTETPLRPVPGEFLLPEPPEGFLQRIGASLLYAPFGACTYAEPGLPAVALIADLLHRDYPHSLTPAQIEEREAFISHTVATAAMLQSISRNGAERLMLHYGVPEERIFFTYLPVQARLDAPPQPAKSAPASSPATPAEPSPFFPPATPYFFYPANLWKHKNHETLLVAYRLYRRQAGKTAWDLVLTFHEDSRAPEIRALARALGIEAHLHTPGYVSEAELAALWRHAGALIFPSLHEGFGIPLIEAMHHGVPIITSPEFSLREIAGEAALFIDPRKPASIAAALTKVSASAPLRETLRQRGHQRLHFFNLELETEKLLQAWRRCASSKLGFPRKPLALETPAALTLPTPASKDRWNLEIRVNPALRQNRYRCYLGDAPFGSFTPGKTAAFHFECQPRGRLLRIIIEHRFHSQEPPRAPGAILGVSASSVQGECLPLFTATPGETL